MVAGVGVGDLCILAARLPVEVSAIDDHAAERRAVATDELGGGVDDDVRAVLEWTEQVRGTEGVVDDDRETMLLGDLGNRIDIGDIGIGVAERLKVDGRGVVLDGALDLLEVVRVNEGHVHAELRDGVLEEVERAAVDGLLGNDMVACLGKCLHGQRDCRGTGGNGETGDAALESSDTVLEDRLR